MALHGLALLHMNDTVIRRLSLQLIASAPLHRGQDRVRTLGPLRHRSAQLAAVVGSRHAAHSSHETAISQAHGFERACGHCKAALRS